MIYEGIQGVPKFKCDEYAPKKNKYCVCIPIINEGQRIIKELERAKRYDIQNLVDIIICDGGSTDGCTDPEKLKKLEVNTLLTKQDKGKQGAQLRIGFWWSLERGYEGIITIDGNNKDSIEDIPKFIKKLEEGYDFIQGSRFINGGKAINTPFIRYMSVMLIHAPIISITARHRFTDTTNAFRAHSKRYLTDRRVQPFRDIFMTYELLAYLSTRATQIGLKVCEVPVTREYPKKGKTPTKISFFKGNGELIKILFKNLKGRYNINET
jgi:dolichol-phosphate mannosyltransferase